MWSGVHNSDFTNRKKAFGKIWGEFSCSRILDEIVWSPHNFRFQAFGADSVSNAIKAHFSVYQQTQSHYSDVTTTGWRTIITWRNSPVPWGTEAYLFHTIVNSQPTNPSYAQLEARSGVISTQSWTDNAMIHDFPQHDRGASRGGRFWFFVWCFIFYGKMVQIGGCV